MIQSCLKVIALDFDGTLVESNRIKDRAFETIFSEWPEHMDAMMQWHLAHNSTERREKFRYFVEEVLALPGRDELIEELTTRFSQQTRQSIIDCPFVKGARNFLKYIQNRVAIYLLSATPQLDLNEIIEERGLDKYFKEIYGAPIDKVYILKKIMVAEEASAYEMLFIGDSLEDQQAAGLLGIQFIGRQSDRPLDDSKNNTFSDFLKIKDYSIKIYGLSGRSI